ncbi:hypothetical protein V8G54_011811 [Vigna mungo]|uniref:Uncharacterized protein n=1 Tax=Vigna mungo TaxID=3915 RepID=A0AAQ3NS08_VIGMU
MTGGAVSSPLNLIVEHGVKARVRGEGNAKEAFVAEFRVLIEVREEGLENNGSMRGKNKSSRGKNKSSRGKKRGWMKGKNKSSRGKKRGSMRGKKKYSSRNL